MLYLYIGIGVVILIGILILLIRSFLNKINVYVIKINEADKNIEFLLEKKTELLTKIKEQTKEELDIDILENLPKIKNQKLDSFELDAELESLEREMKDTLEFNKKIILGDELTSLIDSLDKTNIGLKATKTYYNDNAEEYNNKVTKFPKRIIAKIKGHTELDFYETKKEEEFEILKKKN